METKTTKHVAFAYWSSYHAEEYNQGKACWLVYPSETAHPTVFHDMAGAKTAAFDFADSLPGDYGKYSMKRNDPLGIG